MPPRVLPVAITITVLLAAPQLHARPRLPELQARPASPATIAALVQHASDVSAQATLVEALASPDADVRAMAARVTFVTRAALAVPSVPRALAAETDDRAAAEMTRVVATFDGAAQLESLVAAARSHGPATRAALLESLARSHPALLVKVSGNQSFDDASLAPALVVASALHVAERAVIARAAVARGPGLWASYLRGMHEHLVPVEPVVLQDTLAAPDERLRTATAYHVAMLAGHIHGADRAVLAAAADGAEAGTATTWERAYREIARRALKRPARQVDWATLLGREPENGGRSRFDGINATLLREDRDTVQALVGTLPGAEYYVGSAGRDHPESRYQKTRTIDSRLAGLLPGLRALFGCSTPDARLFAAATMIYHPDGRARLVRTGEVLLPEGCASAAHVVFLLTIAPSTQPVLPQASDGIYLPFVPEYLACAETPAEPTHDAMPGPRHVMPRPRSRLEPEYPKGRRHLGIAGTVKVEAEVTSRGCVKAAETLSSLDPILDAQTLRAVLSATFDPMTIDGRPVSSRVVLGVTFKP
jgi:TonB family protein